MIYFPATLTPVPASPGYFWDTKHHRLYSLKVGGVLREMSVRKAHPAMFRHGQTRYLKLKPNDLYYVISNQGRKRYFRVDDLKNLKLIDYDMPLINRNNEKTS